MHAGVGGDAVDELHRPCGVVLGEDSLVANEHDRLDHNTSAGWSFCVVDLPDQAGEVGDGGFDGVGSVGVVGDEVRVVTRPGWLDRDGGWP